MTKGGKLNDDSQTNAHEQTGGARIEHGGARGPASPDTTQQAGISTGRNRGRYLVLAVLCSGIFLAAVDQTVVVTLIPRIINDLEGGFSSDAVERAGWIVTAYLLGYTIVLPLMGRVADLYGHRRTYIIAMTIFAGGSVLCALSTSLYMLVGFRALQAIGGGAVVPIAMAVVGFYFPPGKRALALGVIGAAGEAGGVLGPLYGTLVGQLLGWRAIFYLNAPLVLVIVALVLYYTPRGERQRVPVDYRGAVLLAVALGLLTLGISGGRSVGWYRFGIPLAALSACFFAAYVWYDSRAREPLIDLSMFRSRIFSSANLAHFLLGVALITALVQVPLFAYAANWPESLDTSPVVGGLLLVRLTLMIPVGAILGGVLTGRIGGRFVAALGFAAGAVGLFMISGWPKDVTNLRQTTDLLLTGFGFGLVIAPIGLGAINVVKRERMALGSAVLTAARIMGMTVGLAALNSWGISDFQAIMAGNPAPLPGFGQSLGQYLDQLSIWEQDNINTILHVLSVFFLIAAVCSLVAIVPSLFLFGRKAVREQEEQEG